MQQHVGVGVAVQAAPLRVGDLDAAEHQAAARNEAVDVVAEADACLWHASSAALPQEGLGQRQVFRARDFDVLGRAGDEMHGPSPRCSTRDASSVPTNPASRAATWALSRVWTRNACGVCIGPEAFAVDGFRDDAARRRPRFSVSATGRAATALPLLARPAGSGQ